jgi:hypothetical protein
MSTKPKDTTPADALRTLYSLIQALHGIAEMARLDDTIYDDPLQHVAHLVRFFLRPLDTAYCVLADAIRDAEDEEGGAV